MTLPRILLFDIDGTLVSTGGAGTRAMRRAFATCHGRADACDSFSLGGMTDRAIIRRALGCIGVTASEAAIDQVLETYLLALEQEMAAARDARILPGVPQALDLVAALPEHAIGLGTGNVQRGAAVKLGALGLYQRFSFGGFGNDHEDRGDMLAIGAQRGAQQLMRRIGDCAVLVIGDTPKDVFAAQAIGARCLAVATGPFRADVLVAAGADWVVPDLTASLALAVLAGEL